MNLSPYPWSLFDAPFFFTSHSCSLLIACFILTLYSSYPQSHTMSFSSSVLSTTLTSAMSFSSTPVFVINNDDGEMSTGSSLTIASTDSLPHEAGVVVVMVMIVVVVVSIGRTLVFTASSATDIPICNGPPLHYCRCHYCYHYSSRQPLSGPMVSSTGSLMSSCSANSRTFFGLGRKSRPYDLLILS